jgi:hypothetical protein
MESGRFIAAYAPNRKEIISRLIPSWNQDVLIMGYLARGTKGRRKSLNPSWESGRFS